MIAAPTGAARWDREMREIARSFRRLSAAQARSVKARRLKIVSVGGQDTVAGLARAAVDDHKKGWFEVLNGLGLLGAEAPKAGDLVKLVRQRPAGQRRSPAVSTRSTSTARSLFMARCSNWRTRSLLTPNFWPSSSSKASSVSRRWLMMVCSRG